MLHILLHIVRDLCCTVTVVWACDYSEQSRALLEMKLCMQECRVCTNKKTEPF